MEAATAEGAMVKRLVEQHTELKKVADSRHSTVLPILIRPQFHEIL